MVLFVKRINSSTKRTKFSFKRMKFSLKDLTLFFKRRGFSNERIDFYSRWLKFFLRGKILCKEKKILLPRRWNSLYDKVYKEKFNTNKTRLDVLSLGRGWNGVFTVQKSTNIDLRSRCRTQKYYAIIGDHHSCIDYHKILLCAIEHCCLYYKYHKMLVKDHCINYFLYIFQYYVII